MAESAGPKPQVASGPSGSRRGRAALQVLALVAMAGVMVMVLVATMGFFTFNADVLSPAALYRDLFQEHLGPTSWVINPSYVPDMLLLFPLLAITGGNVAVSYTLYGILYFALLVAAIWFLVFSIVRPSLFNAVALGLSILVWLCIAAAGGGGELFRMIVPLVHGGTLPAGIASAALTIRMIRRRAGAWSCVAWVAVASAAAASDVFYLLHFLAPILVSLFLLSYVRFVPPRKFLLFAGLAAISVGIAWGFSRIVQAMGFRFCTDEAYPPTFIQVSGVGKLLAATTHNLGYAARHPAAILAWACMAVSLAIVVGLFVKLRRSDGTSAGAGADGTRLGVLFVLLFMLFSVLFAFGFAILGTLGPNRMFIEPAHLRYVWPVFIFPLVFLSLVLTLRHDAISARRKVLWYGLVCAGIVVAFWIGDKARLVPQRLTPQPPPYVSQIDAMAKRYGVANGLDCYWLATPVSLLSRRGVRINPVGVNIDWYQPHSSLLWNFEPPGTPHSAMRRYDFIVLGSGIEESAVVARFGEPAARYDNGDVHALIYNRRSDVAFRSFLRLPVLNLLGRDFGCAIRSPRDLRLFKPDGFPFGDPTNSVIAPGGTLTVVFETRVRGEVLEISADGPGSFEVETFSSDRRTGVVTVPRAPGEALRRRFVVIPPEAAEAGTDRLVIRPLEGDVPHVIGYVAIYPDTWHNLPGAGQPGR